MLRHLLFLLALLSACGDEEDTLRVLSAAGEFPSMNELTAPQGAALRAVNVVVDVPDEYTTHPGLEATATPGRPLSSFTFYAGYLVAHSEADGKLLRYQSGVWTDYDGTYNAPEGELMAFQEAQGALFFTSSAGLYRLDGPTATPVLSGLTQGLPGTGALTASPGFLDFGFTTAYRHSWALNVDAQGNTRLVESAPSPRLLVSNPTATAASRDVVVTWPIPEDLPAGAFNRTFRADAVPETISPTDEMRQVYERAPTDAEIAAGAFTFTDTTPDVVKGAGAYFSANTGEGLAQSNYKSVLVHGLTTFNDSVFAVAVDGIQSITLTLIGIDTTGLSTDPLPLKNGDWLYITDGTTTEEYRALAAEAFPDAYKRFTTGTPAQNIAQTVDSLCRAINSRSGGLAYAFQLDTDGTNPGRFLIRRRTVEQVPLSLYTRGASQPFLPRIPALAIAFAAGSVSRVGGVTTVNVTGGHAFSVDETVRLEYPTGVTPDPNFPAGEYVVTGSTPWTSFTYADPLPDANTVATQTWFVSNTDPGVTVPGTASNAYAWSKQGEPDHWPLANLATVGGATETLWWGAPLDRFLFLGSDAGLYRLEGNARDGFALMDNGVWDNTVSFLGRRNVAVIDGQGYAISREGIVSWSEGSKPESADIPIQDEIRQLVAAIPDKVAELGFMVPDDTNHRLYVCLPRQASDVAATVCHILSTRTGAWTRLDDTFPGFSEGFLAGHAPRPGEGVSYFLGRTSTGPGLAPILSTRNTRTAADYQGPTGQGIPAKVTYLPLVAGEPGRMKQWTWTRVFTKEPTTKLTVCFASEWQPVEECQLLPDIDPKYTGYEPISDPVRGIAWRTIVDKFRQRAKALTVAVGHNQPQEALHLLGLEVKHRPYGGGQ